MKVLYKQSELFIRLMMIFRFQKAPFHVILIEAIWLEFGIFRSLSDDRILEVLLRR